MFEQTRCVRASEFYRSAPPRSHASAERCSPVPCSSASASSPSPSPSPCQLPGSLRSPSEVAQLRVGRLGIEEHVLDKDDGQRRRRRGGRGQRHANRPTNKTNEQASEQGSVAIGREEEERGQTSVVAAALLAAPLTCGLMSRWHTEKQGDGDGGEERATSTRARTNETTLRIPPRVPPTIFGARAISVHVCVRVCRFQLLQLQRRRYEPALNSRMK